MVQEDVKKDVVEEVKKEEVPIEHEYSPIEKQAMGRGWKPKDQWEGDPDEWRSAKEHVERGEMIGKIIAQGRELEDLKRAVNFMTDNQRKQFNAGYAKAIEETKARRDAAAEEGDLKAVNQLNDKITDLKEQASQVRAQTVQQLQPNIPAPSLDFQRWHGDNTWYGSDKRLTRYADAVGIEFKEENPRSSEVEMLIHVENEVKKEFKHKFQPTHVPNPDGDGRSSRQVSRAPTSASLSAVEKNMTQEERQIMNTILKTTKNLTKEQYLKQYSGQE